MPSKVSKIELTPLDQLFTTQDERDDLKLERILELPIAELMSFKNHPFKVNKDDELSKMADSIKDYGVLVPALARPVGGGYELVSGHRRKVACELLGIESMPVIVREMSDDQAVILMVDSNLQREHILPSERAFAYKMKLGAIKHQGQRSDLTSAQVVPKLNSRDKVAEDAGVNRMEVTRYIRLTELIPQLLEMVDNRQIAFNPAVELSYLTHDEQKSLIEAMECEDCTPSLSQAQRFKKLSQEGKLNADVFYAVLTEEKPNQKEQLRFSVDSVKKFFPKDYSAKQMEEIVLKLLSDWQKRRERARDER